MKFFFGGMIKRELNEHERTGVFMSKKNKEHIIFRSDISDIDNAESVTTASAQECTGLISRDPKSRSQRAAYEDIVGYSGDAVKKKN